MEKTNLLTLVVTLTVGIILAGSLLMPVISDATETERTFQNEEYFFTMDKIDDTAEHTILWTLDTYEKITVDGVDITPTWDSATIVAEEDNLIRCSKNPGGDGYYLNFVGTDRPVGLGYITDKSVSITISNGTISFTNVSSTDVSTTVTSSYTSAYIINPEDTGAYQYVMKTPTAKSYVLGDSEVYGIGYSSFGGAWQNIFVISGSIDDGIDATLVSTTLEGDVTVSDTTVTSTAVTGYKDLYQFEKVQFTATYGGIDYALTYSYIIVPASVTAELAEHLNAGEIALMNALPVIVIIGLVLAGVGAIFVKNRD